MLKEFFNAPSRCVRCVAWGGLALVLAHAAVHGWVKFSLNAFYRSFYDVLYDASALASNATTTDDEWAAKRAEVSVELVKFVKIAAVAVCVMPIAKLVRSLWTLQWRLALTKAYLSAWDPNKQAVEGAAQRCQEDAARFAKGTELCLTIGLDALITLGIFVPVLLQLGAETPCPDVVEGYRIFGGGWLVGLAVFNALIGFGVTLLVGHRLVGLEVENQLVEARLRTDLVVLETTPERVCVAVHQPPPSENTEVDFNRDAILQTLMPPLPRFVPTIARVRDNYRRLYLNFSLLHLWLAIFEQWATILPYLIIAPLLFASEPAERIKMGTLIMVSNSFGKVFDSLNVIADNWASVNEYRSALVRLRQFERNIYRGVPHPSRARTRTRVAQFGGVVAEVSMSEIESSASVDVREHL
jgi:putative ATP-binding cassette transporter